MTWLEYSQLVLGKVGFDRKLFRKELGKLLAFLSRRERQLLLRWCRFQKPWVGSKPGPTPVFREVSGVESEDI